MSCHSGVKKSKNFHLSPGQVYQNLYLSCYQITCPCQGKINYQCIFYLSAGHWVKYMLVLLEIQLSRAPGQVIFLPLHCCVMLSGHGADQTHYIYSWNPVYRMTSYCFILRHLSRYHSKPRCRTYLFNGGRCGQLNDIFISLTWNCFISSPECDLDSAINADLHGDHSWKNVRIWIVYTDLD